MITTKALFSSLRGEDLAVLKGLQHSKRLYSVLAISIDWAVIFGSVATVSYYSYLFVPVALVLIGSRQRALSNLVHDASHYNLFRSKSINDGLANIFAAYPMFFTIDTYRESHLKHHHYLGTEKDPDSQMHRRYGYNDGHPSRLSPLSLYLTLVFSKRSVTDSFLGDLAILNIRQTISVLFWWIATMVSLSFLTGPDFAVVFLALWFVSKLTSYHLIRVFAEFLDHRGLPVGDTFTFTRNMPHTGLTRFFIHPHQDTYHLVHHLLPKVPHYRLMEAHQILLRNVIYLKGHHCTSYWFGKHSAVRCWIGACKENA